MIKSQLGRVHLSELGEETLKECERLNIDAKELLQSIIFADFFCIMCALVDEYGLEAVLQEVTKNCEQLIKERTNNGNTNNML